MKTFKLGFCALLIMASGVLSAQRRVYDADGVRYEVVDSREEIRPDCDRCGYNHRGLGRPALFRFETRVYFEYRYGRLRRTWTERHVPIFVRCYGRYE